MVFDPAVGIKEDIVELERHRVEIVVAERLVEIAGPLGEMGKSLWPEGSTLGIVDAHREGQDIQKLTDTYVGKADEIHKTKEKDIMTV